MHLLHRCQCDDVAVYHVRQTYHRTGPAMVKTIRLAIGKEHRLVQKNLKLLRDAIR